MNARTRSGFADSVRFCMQNYGRFEGRATRAEYWYFVLFLLLCRVAGGIIGVAIGWAPGLGVLVILALLAPYLAVTVRRLHDIDRSGWWYFIVLLPVVGWILLLIWHCTRGTEGSNRFGGDPLLVGA